MPDDEFGHDDSIPINATMLLRAFRDLAKWEVTVGGMMVVSDAARYLGVSRQRIVQLYQAGRIRSAKFGRNTFVPLPDLKAYRKEVLNGEALGGRGNKALPVYG